MRRARRGKRNELIAALCLLTLAVRGLADPLNGSLEYGTSVAGNPLTRSVFSNPAALAFESMLNGSALGVSTTFGLNDAGNANDDFSVGAAYGVLGVGVERLRQPGGDIYNRYGISLAGSLFSSIFFGARYQLVRPNIAPTYDSLDLGVQYRPHPKIAFGLLANRVNGPDQGGTKLSRQYVAGVAIRPIPELELQADVDTLSTNFAKKFGYQLGAAYEIVPGLRLRAGYHDTYKLQFGIQIFAGAASVFSQYQPGAPERLVIFGAQLAARPFRSELQPRTALKILIDDKMDEEGSAGTLLSKGRPSLLELLSVLEQAREQDAVKLVLIKIDSFPLGLAAASDVHQAILHLKSAGKRVEVFLGSAGLKEYLVASAADSIQLEAAGELRFFGLKSERYFLKGTLDKIGVEGEFLAKGDYKFAPEMFLRKESSDLNRKSTYELLDQAEEEILKILGRARAIDRAKWKTLTERVLYGADDAQRARLIDGTESYEAALERLEGKYLVRETLGRSRDELALPKRIAVVVAQGDILDKKVRVLSLAGGAQVTPDKMGAKLKAASTDSRTVATVLRVTSPGGEILASHRIAESVRRVTTKMPLVVSMGDVAASGGYYISAPADRIVTSPLTLTGSVGVFVGKVNLEGLFDKIDLHKEVLSRSPYPALFTEDRPWSAGERAIMQRRLDDYYSSFVKFVAASRKMTVEKAETAAQGRVWLGASALKLGLSDETGGYREAIEAAAKKAGIEGDYDVVLVREKPGLFDVFGEDSLLGGVNVLESMPGGDEITKQAARISLLKENPFLFWFPVKRLE